MSDTAGHAPRPTKDCRICNKRRIKCDRTLPDCTKCGKRGYKCPGYGDRLRWGQGVASRGRLKGLSLPVEGAKSNPEGASLLGTPAAQANGRGTVAHSGLHGVKQVAKGAAMLSPSSGPTSALSAVFNPLERRLLHHFNATICGQLVWVDSDNNPWRTLVLPLAVGSSVLIYSMLAMAAADLSLRYDSQGNPGADSSLCGHYQDKALALLADDFRVRREFGLLSGLTRRDEATEQSRTAAKAVLSAIILLFYSEWQSSGLISCQIHFQAVTAILQRQGLEALGFLDSSIVGHDRPYPSLDDISAFLIQECLSLKSWTQFSHFETSCRDAGDDIDWSMCPPDRRGLFVEFLHLIQDITDYDRRARQLSRSTAHSAPLTVSNLQAKSSRAYHQTIQLATKLASCSSQDRGDICHVAGMFYHAVLIYAGQVLARTNGHNVLLETDNLAAGLIADRVDLPIPSWSVNTSLDQIFHHLVNLENLSKFAQDIFWPLFIAGTKCSGLAEKQAMVESYMLKVIELSGGLDRRTCLRFLKEFWAEEPSSNSRRDNSSSGCILPAPSLKADWIDVATEWASQGNKFIIL